MEIIAIKKKFGKSDIEPEFQIAEIYEEVLPAVSRFVQRMGGTLEDARDVFQDALVIYLEIKEENKRKIHSSRVAYILGIAKHLWIRKYKDRSREVILNEMEIEITIPPTMDANKSMQKLLRLLEITGQKCLDFLRAIYFQPLTMDQVASKFGYKNSHSASVQKYKCLEKIRTVIKEKSLSYEDFME